MADVSKNFQLYFWWKCLCPTSYWHPAPSHSFLTLQKIWTQTLQSKMRQLCCDVSLNYCHKVYQSKGIGPNLGKIAWNLFLGHCQKLLKQHFLDWLLKKLLPYIKHVKLAALKKIISPKLPYNFMLKKLS